jgi:DeoR family transcriptional regulator, glycerol-3-phosphate regulon repressor
MIQQNQLKSLKAHERQLGIVTALRQHGRLTVGELARLMSVSEETIRRDAVPLEQNGEVIKVHGALSMPHNVGEGRFERRMRENAPAKLAIARAAVGMVNNGDSLVLDSGTSTAFLARELRAKQNLTVITNSTHVAQIMAEAPGNKVYLAGGELDVASGAAHGPQALDFLVRFRVKHAFISVTALDLESGAMDAHTFNADFANTAFSVATHRVVLADHAKFGLSAFARICPFRDIEVIVTDQSPPPEFFATFQETGTRLVIAN